MRHHRIVLAALALACTAAAAPAALACTAGSYTYAGLVGPRTVAGVGATVTPSAEGFDVLAGHVAGWVGVGGPGQGPGGSDEWLQVGLATFPLWNGHDVYYELARPGSPPTYHRVRASVMPGSPVRLAVLEMHGRANWWRVWVGGAPASPPIYLPASDSRWRPVVTAESWDGGTSSCNAFLYRFAGIDVALQPGGLWTAMAGPEPIDSADTAVHRAGPRFDAAGGTLGLRALAAAAASAAEAASAPGSPPAAAATNQPL